MEAEEHLRLGRCFLEQSNGFIFGDLVVCMNCWNGMDC